MKAYVVGVHNADGISVLHASSVQATDHLVDSVLCVLPRDVLLWVESIDENLC